MSTPSPEPINLEKINQLIAEGYIFKRSHASGELFIYTVLLMLKSASKPMAIARNFHQVLVVHSFNK
ncbi:hypothetical protein HCU40_15110 [Pseudanabaena biceps]|nr:hypothetical protein [Pseudanabaena biceps]